MLPESNDPQWLVPGIPWVWLFLFCYCLVGFFTEDSVLSKPQSSCGVCASLFCSGLERRAIHFPHGPSASPVHIISKDHLKTDAVNQDVAGFQPCDGCCTEGTTVTRLRPAFLLISRPESPTGNDTMLCDANWRCCGGVISKSVLVIILETD